MQSVFMATAMSWFSLHVLFTITRFCALGALNCANDFAGTCQADEHQSKKATHMCRQGACTAKQCCYAICIDSFYTSQSCPTSKAVQRQNDPKDKYHCPFDDKAGDGGKYVCAVEDCCFSAETEIFCPGFSGPECVACCQEGGTAECCGVHGTQACSIGALAQCRAAIAQILASGGYQFEGRGNYTYIPDGGNDGHQSEGRGAYTPEYGGTSGRQPGGGRYTRPAAPPTFTPTFNSATLAPPTPTSSPTLVSATTKRRNKKGKRKATKRNNRRKRAKQRKSKAKRKRSTKSRANKKIMSKR